MLPIDVGVCTLRAFRADDAAPMTEFAGHHAGFQREGLMRCASIKDGLVLDEVMYARYRA